MQTAARKRGEAEPERTIIATRHAHAAPRQKGKAKGRARGETNTKGKARGRAMGKGQGASAIPPIAVQKSRNKGAHIRHTDTGDGRRTHTRHATARTGDVHTRHRTDAPRAARALARANGNARRRSRRRAELRAIVPRAGGDVTPQRRIFRGPPAARPDRASLRLPASQWPVPVELGGGADGSRPSDDVGCVRTPISPPQQERAAAPTYIPGTNSLTRRGTAS